MAIDLREVSQQVRLQQYAAMVQECKASGMTVRAWCEENGIAYKNYYYRQRRVRKALLEMEGSGSSFLNAPAHTIFAKLPTKAFAQTGNEPATTINVNGLTIDIYSGAGADVIKASLKAVMDIC